MSIELQYSMFASERTTMKLSQLGWTGRSRSKKASSFTGALLTLICRINLETGEQTVLSAHNAPVKSVVYSREHGK
jgi:hypothetical protein